MAADVLMASMKLKERLFALPVISSARPAKEIAKPALLATKLETSEKMEQPASVKMGIISSKLTLVLLVSHAIASVLLVLTVQSIARVVQRKTLENSRELMCPES